MRVICNVNFQNDIHKITVQAPRVGVVPKVLSIQYYIKIIREVIDAIIIYYSYSSITINTFYTEVEVG